MSDCQLIHDELLELEHTISTDLENARSTRGVQARSDTLAQTSKRITTAQKLMHQLRHELRGVENQRESAEYEQMLKAHQKTVTGLNATLRQLKSEATLVQVDLEDPEASSTGISQDRRNARRMGANISNIQDDTISTATGVIEILVDTEAIAGQATTTLANQRTDLVHIKEDLNTVDGNVKRARNEMNAFMRRMMADRLVLAFMFLVVLGIIAMIIVSLVKRNSSK